MRTAAAMLVALACAAAAPSATTARIDLRPFIKGVVRVSQPSSIPVLLPSSLLLERPAGLVFSTAIGEKDEWLLALTSRANCGGANACFIASFDAERGKKLPAKANTRLAGNLPALFHPVSCGGSCAPATLWFVRRGILYTWQVKSPPRDSRAAMLEMAADALRAGPRG